MRTYVAERFWSRVTISESGCWEWSTRGPGGYGRFKAAGRNQLAHRFSYELNVGSIPDGLMVCHSCDNPPCIRPSHLFLGTQRDNIRDMVAKGRGLNQIQQQTIQHPRGPDHWMRQHPSRIARGSAHGKSKLTEDKVREIRRLSKEGWTLARLSVEFGVRMSTLSYVIRRETWAHVKE